MRLYLLSILVCLSVACATSTTYQSRAHNQWYRSDDVSYPQTPDRTPNMPVTQSDRQAGTMGK